MHTTQRFMFDSVEAASEALATVLQDARTSKVFYQFYELTPEAVMSSGLLLAGDLENIAPKLEDLQGTISYME